jgi:hypothetical protein
MTSAAGRYTGEPDYDVLWPPGSGVTCIDLLAPADAALAERLRSELAALADQEPLLVDLGHADPIDAECVRRLAGAIVRGRAGRVAVVCPRQAERQALRALGVERLAPVFASRGDALQARELYLAGFGQGWLPGRVGASSAHLRPARLSRAGLRRAR